MFFSFCFCFFSILRVRRVFDCDLDCVTVLDRSCFNRCCKSETTKKKLDLPSLLHGDRPMEKLGNNSVTTR